MKIFIKILSLVFCILFSFSLFSCHNQSTFQQNSWLSYFFNSQIFSFSIDDYVTLGQYKSLSVTEKKVIVSEQEYQDELSHQLFLNSELIDVTDRGIQNEDIVLIDYYCHVIGDESLSYFDENYEIEIGIESDFPQISNKLLNGRVGQKLTIELTFPLDYFDKDLAGKNAIFNVTIKRVTKLVASEFNDDFVRSVSKYSSTNEYEKYLRDYLYDIKKKMSESLTKEKLLMEIVRSSSFLNIPQDYYNYKKNDLKSGYLFYAKINNISFDEVLKVLEIESFDDFVMTEVQKDVIILAISEIENIRISTDDYPKIALEYVAELGYNSVEAFVEDNGEIYLKMQLLKEKVMDFVYEKSDVNFE